jgi:hypothetical protein
MKGVGAWLHTGRLQCQQHAPIGPELEAILRESGTQHIPAEPFQPSTIIRGHADIGVQVEAVQMRLAWPAGDVTAWSTVCSA